MSLDNTTAYLLLGGNLGNREENLKNAIIGLEMEAGKITAISSVYETAAWGKTDQPAFLNQAVAINTPLTALELLDIALSVEKNLGRIRKDKWGERLIDIDLILFGSEIINIEGKLQVPHPFMQDRKFVMQPLAEIAPEVMHPVFKKSILELSENILDKLAVNKL